MENKEIKMPEGNEKTKWRTRQQTCKTDAELNALRESLRGKGGIEKVEHIPVDGELWHVATYYETENPKKQE